MTLRSVTRDRDIPSTSPALDEKFKRFMALVDSCKRNCGSCPDFQGCLESWDRKLSSLPLRSLKNAELKRHLHELNQFIKSNDEVLSVFFIGGMIWGSFCGVHLLLPLPRQ